MLQVIERTEGRYDVREEFGEVLRWRFLESVVLECDCRASLILDGHAFVGRAELDVLACSVCGERFVLTRMMARRGGVTTGHRKARSAEEEHRYS